MSDEEWLDNCRNYLNMWMELLIAEKRRQMNHPRPYSPDEMWPRWLPWEVTDVFTIPIVMWLSKPRGKRGGDR